MALRPGDVIRVWDRYTRPPKSKRMICISSERQLFLRINSNARFRPNHPIAASGADFLDHDSFVELRQLIRPFAYEIQQADYLGQLTFEQAAALLEAVRTARTLSEEHKELIAEQLKP